MSAKVNHRRYKSPDEVRRHIDKIKNRAIAFLQEAEKREDTVRLLKRPPEAIAADIERLAKEAEDLRKRANAMIHIRIPKLSQKLAVISTPILPGIACDESIPQRTSVE